jgi:hypothetical protein
MSGGLLTVCEFELTRRSPWLDRFPPNLEPAGVAGLRLVGILPNLSRIPVGVNR